MVETDRKVLIERLDAEQCSCVIYNGGETRLFWKRGVQDLYRLLKTEPDFLRGAFIADKVIGKAAAALMALGGVDEVFARVISSPARNRLVSVGDSLFPDAHGRRVSATGRGIYTYDE